MAGGTKTAPARATHPAHDAVCTGNHTDSAMLCRLTPSPSAVTPASQHHPNGWFGRRAASNNPTIGNAMNADAQIASSTLKPAPELTAVPSNHEAMATTNNKPAAHGVHLLMGFTSVTVSFP